MRKTTFAAAMAALLGIVATMLVTVSAPAGAALVDRDCGDFLSQAAAQNFFLANGGPHNVLIAHAMAIGAVVVTRDRPAPGSKRKIKIPDACEAFGVVWTDPFSLYRTLGCASSYDTRRRATSLAAGHTQLFAGDEYPTQIDLVNLT